MAKVGLQGMKFYAFHGYYEFERRIGNEFIIDVMVDIDIDGHPDDKIANTYNYEEIYHVCSRHMVPKYKLLESLAHDIAKDIKAGSDLVKTVNIKIEKLNPNIGGKIGKAVVEMSI